MVILRIFSGKYYDYFPVNAQSAGFIVLQQVFLLPKSLLAWFRAGEFYDGQKGKKHQLE
jgi:hypothetical protein